MVLMRQSCRLNVGWARDMLEASTPIDDTPDNCPRPSGEINRYGNATGRYALCRRCGTRWKWQEDLAGWVFWPQSRGRSTLPLPTPTTTVALSTAPGTRAKAKAKASNTPSLPNSPRFRPSTRRAPQEFDLASHASGMSYEVQESPSDGEFYDWTRTSPENRSAEAVGERCSEGRRGLGHGAVHPSCRADEGGECTTQGRLRPRPASGHHV